MTLPDDKIEVRILSPDDSLEELTELLHRAYKSLADMGLKYVATYQSVDITKKRIRTGTCFVALAQDRIVGTLTYHSPGNYKDKGWMSAEGVGHVQQLGVDPEYKGRGIANLLMDKAEEYARQQGDKHISLDTAEPAKDLIAWYERRGYKFIEHTDWEVTNYLSVVMSKEL